MAGGLEGGKLTSNDAQDALEFIKHPIIPESKHLVTLLFQPGCPPSVILFLVHMLPAVEFNDQLFFEACEVYNILTQGMLPPEFVVAKLTAPQFGPQELFGVCLVGSEFTGVFLMVWI